MQHFWTAEGAAMPLHGHQRGGVAFLACSGPSINSLDLSLLRYVWWMGVNNSPAAIRDYCRPDGWILVDDPTRMLASIWRDPKIQKFVPMAHAEKEMWDSTQGRWRLMADAKGRPLKVRQMPNVTYFRRNEKFMPERWLYEDSVNWGNHSDFKDDWGHKGGRSVMFASIRILHLLGFRTVYLLGCDFKMNRRNKYSFAEKREKGAIKCNTNSYAAMNDRFKALLPHFKAAGYTVYNCNPDS
jgi:hypothetical protein